jgi:hypothetical protein
MSLFQAVMGEAFGRLAPPLQHFHSLKGRHALEGRVQADAPLSRAARVLALCLGTPREAMTGVIRFDVDASIDRESWTRHFPQHVMRSRMQRDGDQLVESLGPVRLHFTLVERGGALHMHLTVMRILGLPCPRWLLPAVHAVESARDGAVCFDVRASLPWTGTVSAYRGHLLLPAQRSAP